MTAARIPCIIALTAVLLSSAANAQEARGPDIWPREALSDPEMRRMGRSALPFTQEQIRTLARLVRQTQRATADGAAPPPKGRTRRIVLRAAGDSPIPAIAVSYGYTTAIGVTDVTGAPWPIEEAIIDQAFLPADNATPSSGGRHLVYLSPRAPFLQGNLILKLRDLAEPVVASLAGDDAAETDWRVDLRLGLPGPDMDPEALLRPESFHAGDPALLGVLTGHAPPTAQRVIVDGGSHVERAWKLDDDLLLVTRLHLLSPGPVAAERGAGGRWAYRLPFVPIVLVSREGTPIRLTFRQDPESEAVQ